MHRTVVVVLLALALLPSCVKKKEEASSSEAKPTEKPGGLRASTVDEMIRLSYDHVGTGYFVASIEIEYVRSDGTLDPTYGRVTVETGKRRPPKPPKPADDPSRPIGAPEPVAPVENDYIDYVMAKCPKITWTAAGMQVASESSCSMFSRIELARPRCTVFGIIAASVAAGAPANALAKIEFHTGYSDSMPQNWKLSIDDNPRDIHFHHEGTDDCAPIAEKP